MFEMMLCSLLTIFPDYLYRRYRQGKRWGKELTIFSVWYELRWGITCCIILTVSLITLIFYNHPSTSNVTAFFRTVPILPETIGRVAEIYVDSHSTTVKKGAPIFRLDSSRQEAATEAARRKLAEVDAQLAVVQTDILKAEGQLEEAKGSLQQANDELDTKNELYRRNPGNVAFREIERLQVRVKAAEGSVSAATAARDSGVDGRVEQFLLRVGDLVNPLMRPAGVLIPEGAGQQGVQAGFSQIEAQIVQVGMAAEITCISKPWKVIPMVVTGVQDFIAAGQFRAGEQLIDLQQVRQPGTILVYLEPLYKGGLDGVTPGSSCIANAYSSNHDTIQHKDTGFLHGVALHGLDALALVHALILRLQALVLPFKTLVFSGH
jgi:multidrug resistance efflux pump